MEKNANEKNKMNMKMKRNKTNPKTTISNFKTLMKKTILIEICYFVTNLLTL